jgi:membrane-bound lytic murein transglycosylase D
MMINNDFLKLAALLFCQSAFITTSHAQVDLKPASGSALAASPLSSSSASPAPAAITSRAIEGAVIEPKVIPLLESPAITTFTVPDELVAKPISESEMASKIAPMRAFDAGSLWDRLRGGFKMADLNTPLAQEKTTWYARQPEYIGRMTERGGQYLFYIVEELERRNMPSELALLPFVESAFNPQAVSSAKAAGMWQFMPATGKHFNLKQNVWRDERRGVVESTRAALDYLQKLHGMFGDWHLALAAYNWGEGSVQRAMNKNRSQGLGTQYTDLNMPNETQHYVPKFQAMKNIVQNPQAYGINLAPLANQPFFAKVVKERDIDVSLAAKFAGMSLAEFKALNPSFKKPVILGANRPEILLPASKLATFNESLLNHRGAMSTWTTVTLSGTEKPANVAKRFGMSEIALRELNNIPARMLIKPGSTLVVPKSNPDAQTANISASLDNATVILTPELIRRGVVARKGDTWAKLAKRTGMSVASLRGWNKGVEPRKGARITYYTAAGTGHSNASARSNKRHVAKRGANKRVVVKPRAVKKRR